jgi:glycolate oxidase FAD binding subunit
VRPYGEVAVIDQLGSRRLWAAIRDVTVFVASGSAGESPLWRVTTAPSRGAELVARITATTAAEALYDWAGGLVWIALPAREDAAARQVRAAAAAVGGSAMLFRASAQTRAAIDVFDPQEPSLAALTKRVKEGFDPNRVLNPGRMWAQV